VRALGAGGHFEHLVELTKGETDGRPTGIMADMDDQLDDLLLRDAYMQSAVVMRVITGRARQRD